MESGINRFGGFFQRPSIKEFANGSWELLKHSILLRDGMTITDSGGIWHSRAGGKRIGRVVGDIGNQQGNLLRWCRSLRQPPTLDRRKMFSDGIDLDDRRTGENEHAVHGDQIFEGNFVIDRFFSNR